MAKSKLLKNKIARVGQEVWENNGRKVSIINLTSNFFKSKDNHRPEVAKMLKDLSKMLKDLYGKYVWEWIELPTKKNGNKWSDPERYETKKEARKHALKYLQKVSEKKLKKDTK